MQQTWRWFGPNDKVTLADAAQAGAQGIVTALHELPSGAPWSLDAIRTRQAAIATLPSGEASGLQWDVVESVFVSEDIKSQTGDWRSHIEAYKESLRNLGRAGIGIVAYHFMPVLDWTRTDLAFARPGGGTALRLDLAALAAFDLYVLKRPGAGESYDAETVARADALFGEMRDDDKARLTRTIIAGLPGSNEGWTIDQFRERLDVYAALDADTMRRHMIDFLSEIVPVCEEAGIRLACHPDDPPFAILGLPRFMSTASDFQTMFDAVPSPVNGMTFCVGSLGSRPDNDLPEMVRRFGPRVHFAHLRNVRREAETVPCSFFEDEHLAGSSDMVAVVDALLAEEARRRAAGDDGPIPMRPDHGHAILTDIGSGANPGYTAVGRLKGLAELRGVMRALEHRAH